MDSILARCDPITTFEDARRPVITPLLPVKGLRRDASGTLTTDSLRTILEGLRAYGLSGPNEQVADAILAEARGVLCTLNGQYQFLLDDFLTKIARAEKPIPQTLDLIREKNQQMQDVISLSRQAMATAASGKEGFQVGTSAVAPSFLKEFTTQQTAMRLREGFAGRVATSLPRGGFLETAEGFQIMFDMLQTDAAVIEKKQYFDLKRRRYEDTKEKNTYLDRQIGLYTFVNVVAIGLFLYIVSS